MHPGNPNVRRRQNADGEVTEYVDPLADLGELMFSRTGLALIIGADLLVNDGGLLGAGVEFGGELLDGAGNLLNGGPT